MFKHDLKHPNFLNKDEVFIGMKIGDLISYRQSTP